MASRWASDSWFDSASNLMPDGPAEGCASSGMRLRRRISSGSMPIFAAASSTRPSVDAVGDELDRALEQLGQRDRRHLVGVGVHLDAERAADVLGDDPHLVLLEPQ